MKTRGCKSNILTLQAFLNAIDANPINAMYIECKSCRYEKSTGCEDYLFAPDSDGSPLLVPVGDINIICNSIADKSECVAVMSSSRFMDLFKKWLTQFASEHQACPLQNVVKGLKKPEDW